MEGYLITIDGGTTHTRIAIWSSKQQMILHRRFPIGVRITAVKGDRTEYISELKKAIAKSMSEVSLTWNVIEGVCASGMITSNLGIYEVEHIMTPAGINELSRAVVKIHMPELCPKAIWLIPGVRCVQEESGRLETTDMMRGEETEVMAVLSEKRTTGKTVIFLPGSHDKVVFVDEEQRIVHLLTSITGELLRAITLDTVLADNLERSFASEEDLEEEWLYKGFRQAGSGGLGNACFKARILQSNKRLTCTQARSYVLGAVLENDFHMLTQDTYWKSWSEAELKIIVVGKSTAAAALVWLLNKEYPYCSVTYRKEKEEISFAAVGEKIVWQKACKNKK